MSQATKSKGTRAVRVRSATGQFVKQPEVAAEPEAIKPAERRRTSAGRRAAKRLQGAEATADNGVSKVTQEPTEAREAAAATGQTEPQPAAEEALAGPAGSRSLVELCMSIPSFRSRVISQLIKGLS